MKKQTNPFIKAHLFGNAVIHLSLIAVCVMPFALGQRTQRERASTQTRTLKFAERVAYQRAVEDVYWRSHLAKTAF